MIVYDNILLSHTLMLKTERHSELLQLIRKQGFIQTDELASLLNVSQVTIRRDIKELDQKKLICMQYGGAATLDFLQIRPEPEYETKMQLNAPQKKAIGREALNYINDGDTLIIDAGTTCLEIAMHIAVATFSGLSVITNDILSCNELSANQNIKVIMLGGITRNNYHNVYGPYAESIVSNLRANKFFFAFDGFTDKRGFSSTFLEEIPLKQKMIESSSSVIAVSDSSKIGEDALYKICGPEKIDRIITDNWVSDLQRDSIIAQGIEISIAEITE